MPAVWQWKPDEFPQALSLWPLEPAVGQASDLLASDRDLLQPGADQNPQTASLQPKSGERLCGQLVEH